MLRVYLRRDRRLLGNLSQCAADSLETLFRAASKESAATPGIIMVIQTYGDLVNFHPHLHALVTDGGSGPMKCFVAFPEDASLQPRASLPPPGAPDAPPRAAD